MEEQPEIEEKRKLEKIKNLNGLHYDSISNGNTRIEWIDALRALAMFFVITGYVFRENAFL